MASPFRSDVLAGQVALITGGSSGIGLEITRQLVAHGANAVICGRRASVVDDAVAVLRSEGLRGAVAGTTADVRSPEDAAKLFAFVAKTFGDKLHVLVNCAAGNFLALPEELSTNGFKTVMDIDAVGTFNMCRAAHPMLRAARGAVVINISATLHYGSTWYQTHACAAKAAVDAMTRSLALEWGAHGIRVCGVAPGPIAGTAGMAKLAPGGEGALQAVVAEIPLGRMGTKTDIAYACVFLASPAAAFVSGDTLVVDGAAWIYRTPVAPRTAIGALARKVEGTSRAVGLAKAKL